MTDSALARSRPAAPRHSHQARHGDLTVVPSPVPAPAPLPALRLLPAPDGEPPYDDDAPVTRSVRPIPQPALRLVPTPVTTPAVSVPAEQAPVVARAPAAAPAPGAHPAPSARPFAVALVHRLVEVRGGLRPVLQLQHDTTPTLFADLERAMHHRPRTADTARSGRDVRSVHVQERPDGVAEVCATVRRGGRMAALALRLEAVGGRWVCTQVQGL